MISQGKTLDTTDSALTLRVLSMENTSDSKCRRKRKRGKGGWEWSLGWIQEVRRVFSPRPAGKARSFVTIHKAFGVCKKNQR